MAAPKKPRTSSTSAKASKPELKPLDPYLAELLSPALNRNRPPAPEAPAASSSKRSRGGAGGFGEAPQAGFSHDSAADVDPRLAAALGLKGPEDAPSDEGETSLATDGVSATVDALSRLLTEGNPLFKDGQSWQPHRPERPKKSEGGVPFRLQSEFEPAGDQPRAIAELVTA